MTKLKTTMITSQLPILCDKTEIHACLQSPKTTHQTFTLLIHHFVRVNLSTPSHKRKLHFSRLEFCLDWKRVHRNPTEAYHRNAFCFGSFNTITSTSPRISINSQIIIVVKFSTVPLANELYYIHI